LFPGQKFDLAEFYGFLFKNFYEDLTYSLAFLFGRGDSPESIQKSVFRFHTDYLKREFPAEFFEQAFVFALAQKAVVDEDAVKLAADCFLDD